MTEVLYPGYTGSDQGTTKGENFNCGMCRMCEYWANSSYVNCGMYPTGPESETHCSEYKPASEELLSQRQIGSNVTPAMVSEPNALDPHAPTGSIVFVHEQNAFYINTGEQWSLIAGHPAPLVGYEPMNYTIQDGAVFRVYESGYHEPQCGTFLRLRSGEIMHALSEFDEFHLAPDGYNVRIRDRSWTKRGQVWHEIRFNRDDYD